MYVRLTVECIALASCLFSIILHKHTLKHAQTCDKVYQSDFCRRCYCCCGFCSIGDYNGRKWVCSCMHKYINVRLKRIRRYAYRKHILKHSHLLKSSDETIHLDETIENFMSDCLKQCYEFCTVCSAILYLGETSAAAECYV